MSDPVVIDAPAPIDAAVPIDAPPPVDAFMADACAAEYARNDAGFVGCVEQDPPACPADYPYCIAQGLEAPFVCASCCTDIAIECRERMPEDAVLQPCELDGPPGCPGEQPVCCRFQRTQACVDRPLLGWWCNAP